MTKCAAGSYCRTLLIINWNAEKINMARIINYKNTVVPRRNLWEPSLGLRSGKIQYCETGDGTKSSDEEVSGIEGVTPTFCSLKTWPDGLLVRRPFRIHNNTKKPETSALETKLSKTSTSCHCIHQSQSHAY